MNNFFIDGSPKVNQFENRLTLITFVLKFDKYVFKSL